MGETMTIEQVLRELREIFPKGHLRADYGATLVDKGDDPEGESSSFAMVVVSRATEHGAKSFRGVTLFDCMMEVRKWKASNQ